MVHKATSAQQKVFDFVKSGTGNGIIDAVAGAGKTTTLIGCIEHISNVDDAIYCAFNTSIQKELQKEFHKAKKNVRVCTIHSLGYQLLRSTRKFNLNDKKYNNIINDPEFFESLVLEIDKILGYHNHPTVAELRRLDDMSDALDWNEKNQLNEGQQYVRKIIWKLLDINNKYRCTLEEDILERYDAMAQHFGIFTSWEVKLNNYKDELACYFRAHQRLLKEGNSIAISHGIIDYTDQLYLPYVMNLTSKNKYGFVFVDECQDLSKAQIYAVKQYLREDGRLLAVGDPYQSIYGFAGADYVSFQRVKDTFKCTQIALTDCFRCPQSVIQLTQSIRPDIKGFKLEPGKIYKIQMRDVVKNIKEGDLVICRTRKPLLALALKLITKDFKVKIHPDELQEFMGDYMRNFTPQETRKILNDDMIDAFFDRIRDRNEKRIIKENQNTDSIIRRILIMEAVYDMKNTLFFLKKKYFDWHINTIETILTKLKHTLSYPGDEAIKISSIHRAKGLENDRVFILEYNKLPYKREQEWERIQERNLHYVAVTRPKDNLYLVEDNLYINGEDDAGEDDGKFATPEEYVPTQVSNLIQSTTTEESQLIISVEISEEIIKKDSKPQELDVSNLIAPIIKEEEPLPETETVPSGLNPTMSFFIKFLPTNPVAKIPEKFYSLSEAEDTPYPMLNRRNFQKAKYWSIYLNLQDTEFSIANIKCAQNQDVYYINTPNGTEIYQGWYKNSGQYMFKLQGSYLNAEQLMRFLNDESNYNIKFEYQPENYGFEAVHSVIQAACQELGISNTNIFEEQNNLVYCFRTLDSYAYIKLTYNGKKKITTIMPYSTLGSNDTKLNSLLETLKHLWQR